MPRAISTASFSTAAGTAAGAIETSRMWRWCRFSITPKWAKAPSSPRAATTETSRSKSTNASSTHSWPPTASQAAAASSGAGIAGIFTCPLPS